MSIFAPFGFMKVISAGEEPFVLDPDAAAFLTATGITDPTIESAINTLVLDLKAASIWSKMKAIYPFVGGTADTNKYNLVDPQNTDAAYRLTYGGTVTHSSNGIVGNGTDGYYNTYLTTNTMAQNSLFMGLYIRNNVAADRVDMGALNLSPGTNSSVQLNARTAANLTTARCNNASTTTASNANTDSIGFHCVSRLSSASFTLSKNKTHTTKTITSVTPSSRYIMGLCFSIDGVASFFSSRQQALSAVGDGLTTSEINSFVDANQTFQTTLSRFV